GYEVAFALGELMNHASDLLAYASSNTDFPNDGIARTVFPDDLARGRWVSNVTELDVMNVPTGYKETDLVVGCDPINEKPKCDRAAKPLIDANGVVHSAQIFDRHLVNAWGLASTPTLQVWISDNGSGLSTTYVVQSNTPLMVSLGTQVGSIPSPGDPL